MNFDNFRDLFDKPAEDQNRNEDSACSQARRWQIKIKLGWKEGKGIGYQQAKNQAGDKNLKKA